MGRDIFFVKNKTGFNCATRNTEVEEVHGAFIGFRQNIKKDRHWIVLSMAEDDTVKAVYLDRERFSHIGFIFALMAKEIVLNKEDDICITAQNGFVEICVNGEIISVDDERDRTAFIQSGGSISGVLDMVSGTRANVIIRPAVSERAFIPNDISSESVGLLLRELCDAIKKFDEQIVSAPDVEDAVIGCILGDKDSANELLSNLAPDCFSCIMNRNYFEAAYNIWKDYGVPSPEAVAKSIGAEVEELRQVAASASGASTHVEYYAKILLQFRLRRRVIAEAAGLLVAAMDKKTDSSELSDLCKSLTFRVHQCDFN